MQSIVVDKISLQWMDTPTLNKIHKLISENKTYLRMQIDVTDSANQYQKSMGNINRKRSFVASLNMKDIPQNKYTEKLYELQTRIFDQNFTYNPVQTTFHLQFFEPSQDSLQDNDLMNLTIQ